MEHLTNEEIKKRIEELEEQKRKISDEIWELENMNQGYWIGIIDLDYDYEYHRLGFCTETEAKETMENILKESNCLGYKIEEVSEDYNKKMYMIQNLEQAYNSLDMSGKEFAKYNELVKELKKDIEHLKEELDIPSYAYIAD